ncbi:MAG TPA: hypothetical protein VLM85_16030 [Polyangiaceae bacterium]|nr:hypothetical protein [Polyangiaceae bacterium]
MQRTLITLATTILVASAVAVGIAAQANASSGPQPSARDSGAPTEGRDSGVPPTGAWDSGAASNHDM